MDIFDGLTMLGGLCLFLFGMNIMSGALKQKAGKQLDNLLHKMTANRLTGILIGMVATAVLQSSSATSVLTISFVNSGIMTLTQAVGVMMGANVGATATNWLLSLSGLGGGSLILNLLKPSSFTPILALIGVIFYLFDKNQKRKGIGLILLGFSTLMYGMEIMSGSVADLKGDESFHRIFTLFQNPLLGLLAGVLLTMIIQSSSASIGILQALSSAGQISFSAAVPLIMGANIGTCITAVLSAIGASRDGKRIAAVHVSFNVIGTAVFLTIYVIIQAVFKPPLFSSTVNPVTIALINSIFKILCLLLFLPFPNFLENLSGKLIREKTENDGRIQLDERLLSTPALAVQRCDQLTHEMAEMAISSAQDSLMALSGCSEEMAASIRQREEKTDQYEDALGSYLIKVSAAQISEKDGRMATSMLKMISDLERISDYSVSILTSGEEMREKELTFSDQANEELHTILMATNEILSITQRAYDRQDIAIASRVEPLARVIDNLKDQLRTSHILRMQSGVCSIEAGFVWNDLLTSLERLAGHCSNVAGCIIDTEQHNLNLHETLRNIRRDSPAFREQFNIYTRKYRVESEKTGSLSS